MKQTVIGLGEVGDAIFNKLSVNYRYVNGIDMKHSVTNFKGDTDFLHICIPYSETFVKTVKDYEAQYKPLVTIVHSTVPVGTCDANGWVFSPVRGCHPDLQHGLRIFVKYFGGKRAEVAANVFKSLNMQKCVCFDRAKDLEAAKIWDTTQYGWMIVLNKEIKKWCDEHDVDFNIVYEEFNKSYNDGYTHLAKPEVVRPYLRYMEGKIGGHCVIPNLRFLEDSDIANYIRDYNSQCPTKD